MFNGNLVHIPCTKIFFTFVNNCTTPINYLGKQATAMIYGHKIKIS